MSRTAYLHDLAQARAALAAGATRFLTPPDGAFTAGESFYRALLRQLPPVPAILDCGDDGAAAVEALANGWRAIVFSGPARPAVAAIATGRGATVYRRAPAALDLPADRHWDGRP